MHKNDGDKYSYGFKKMDKKIIKIGQAHKNDSQSGIVYDRHGMMVTLIAGTHGYAIGYVLRKYEKNKSDSAGRYRTDGERKQR